MQNKIKRDSIKGAINVQTSYYGNQFTKAIQNSCIL